MDNKKVAFAQKYPLLNYTQSSYFYHKEVAVDDFIKDGWTLNWNTWQHPFGFIMVGSFDKSKDPFVSTNKGIFKSPMAAFNDIGIDMTDIDEDYMNNKWYRATNIYAVNDLVFATKPGDGNYGKGDWGPNEARQNAQRIKNVIDTKFCPKKRAKLLKPEAKIEMPFQSISEDDCKKYQKIDIKQTIISSLDQLKHLRL